MDEDRPILSAAKCRSMILVSRNIRYMRIFAGVSQGGALNDCGVVKEHNFHRLLLAVCLETLDSICGIYTQDIQPFGGFSVVSKCMTLNERE